MRTVQLERRVRRGGLKMAKKKQRSEEYGRKEAAWWADFERGHGEQPLEKKLWVAWRKGFESCQREMRAEIKRLREGLSLIECEPINAEYMARNILDGKPAYHDTMIKVGAGETAHNAKGQRGAACGASAAPTGCASNGNHNERTEK